MPGEGARVSTRSIEDRIGELEAQLGALSLRLEKLETGEPRPHLPPATAAAIVVGYRFVVFLITFYGT